MTENKYGQRKSKFSKQLLSTYCVSDSVLNVLPRGTPPMMTEQIMAISTPVLSLLFSSHKVPLLYISRILNCITIYPVAEAKIWVISDSTLSQPCLIYSSHTLSSLHSFCTHWSPYLENSFSFPSLANFYVFFKFPSSMTLSLTFLVTS